MYILYNNDGSVKAVKLTDFIQKGNNNENSIFLAIKDKKNTEWAATVVFTLPDGSVVGVTPTSENRTIFGEDYSGWLLTIPGSVTVCEGFVDFSIEALNLQGQLLFTYRNKLTINPSVVSPDETTITYAQYQSLLQYIISVIGNEESGKWIYEADAAFFPSESGETDEISLDDIKKYVKHASALIHSYGTQYKHKDRFVITQAEEIYNSEDELLAISMEYQSNTANSNPEDSYVEYKVAYRLTWEASQGDSVRITKINIDNS